MKTIEEMTFTELVEWAEGYILKELIKGNFHDAVFMVCNQITLWSKANPR